MASYLTPNFLLSDINQLLRVDREGAKKGAGTALTKDEFREQYQTGYVNPMTGRTRYYFNYDFGDDFNQKFHGKNVRGETQGRFGSTTVGDGEGYKFYSPDDAYSAYLDSLGGDFGTQTANIFDPQSLAEGISRAKGDEPSSQASVGLTAFTPEMFKKLRTEYYQPEIEQKKGSLIDRLIENQKIAKSRGAGIAGYGGRGRAQQALSEQFETRVKDIFSDIQTKKAAGLQDIYDVLSQYEEI
ncbi:MAG TPA: hypothetical protein DCM40_11925 [Maribacter sp.]|nr:hypothetical protein [Maribacter sp.]|tara:strand:- start:2036 stop:2761 length:726 start_codon:yes stop_codon:yes gene_type:complete